MNRLIRIISIAICTVLIACCIPFSAFAVVGNVSGESGRTRTEIKLSNGNSTGVYRTQMNLSGTYGTKLANFVEANLSDPHVSVEVINNGTYTVSRKTVASAASTYNSTHSGETVLAALNGDLWMTNVNSNSNVTTSTLCVPRGIMMIDGEIWATQEFGMENYVNTSNAGTYATDKSAFGVTSKNQPLVGIPKIYVSFTNETKGRTVLADGLNRLPAWDSLVVYNSRVNTSNYALADAYEILLEADSTAFTLNNKVTATVKSIYPSNSSTKPAINSNSIVLTARGNRVGDISSFSVGDRVSFDFTMYDLLGNTDLWNDVQDAIGGHMQLLGAGDYVNDSASEYPTSLIGLKPDGTVMFCAVSATADGSYKGLKFNTALNFVREAGYSQVFYLDGGGSSTLVTLDAGSYVVRTKSSDGSPRSVINSVAIVWHNTPVCPAQGSMNYLNTESILSDASPEFINYSYLPYLASNPNSVNFGYDGESESFTTTLPKSFNDPSFYINYDKLSRVRAENYKSIVVKVRHNQNYTVRSELFYCCGSMYGAAGGYSKSFDVPAGNDWKYITIGMTGTSGWSGLLNSIRFDTFSGDTAAGAKYEIGFVALCKTVADAAKLARGTLPLGIPMILCNYINGCEGDHVPVINYRDSSVHRTVCAYCGMLEEEEHDIVSEGAVPATCTRTGLTAREYCGVCDYVISESAVLPALPHTVVSVGAVPATCTSEGRTAREYCSVCNRVLAESVAIPVIPHNYVNGVCTECGDVQFTGVMGDVDLSGKVNAADILVLTQAVVGVRTLTAEQMNYADVSGDSKISVNDVNLLTKFVTGTLS